MVAGSGGGGGGGCGVSARRCSAAMSPKEKDELRLDINPPISPCATPREKTRRSNDAAVDSKGSNECAPGAAAAAVARSMATSSQQTEKRARSRCLPSACMPLWAFLSTDANIFAGLAFFPSQTDGSALLLASMISQCDDGHFPGNFLKI